MIYREVRKQYDALCARIRGAGISIVAREAGVSRSAVKALVYQRTVSHRPRIVKITAALERLGAAVLGGS